MSSAFAVRDESSLDPRQVRRAAVKDLLDFASTGEPTSDEHFRTVLEAAQGTLEMSDQDMADALRVSRPTINRWKNGRNLPHRAFRGPLFDWMTRQLAEKLKRLDSLGRLRKQNAKGNLGNSGLGGRPALAHADSGRGER
jgi:DNA-binding transcriptional regulator YiaG